MLPVVYGTHKITTKKGIITKKKQCIILSSQAEKKLVCRIVFF